jgi:transmembrane sensor
MKYVDQTCSEMEQAELMGFINDPEYKKTIEHLMDEVFDEHHSSHRIADLKATTILKRITGTPAAHVYPLKRFIIQKWVAAASILLIFGSAFFIYHFRQAEQRAPLAKLTLAKAQDEHQIIKLDDGSTVILNRQSILKYPVHFNAKLREVTLIGEGYFDIKHDASRPFIVHTGKFSTTVLGTAFNIKSYRSNDRIEVTVTRGKVSVSKDGKLIGVITPNQQLDVNNNSATAQKIHINAEKVVEWRSHDLFFGDITMEEAAKMLEQRFNTKIVFTTEKVKSCRFTATFLHGETLKQILEVICSFNNASFKQETNQTISISGQGCN